MTLRNTRKNQLKVSQSLSLIYLMLSIGGFLWVSFVAAEPVGPNITPPKKEDKKDLLLDPALSGLAEQLRFNAQTIKALERSKESGVMVAVNEEPGKIYRIEIAGTKKIEPDAVMLRLLSGVGRHYDSISVSQDIHNVMDMGLFSNVEVYKKVLPSGAIVLKYILTEIPTIFQVKITGNDLVSEDEIKESISELKEYHIAQPERLIKSSEKIKDLLIAKGYFLAEVNFKTKKTSRSDILKREQEKTVEKKNEIETAKAIAPDFIDVIFEIKEHNKVKVNRISFSGNTQIDDDVLKSSIKTRENSLLSLISDWGVFREDYLEVDMLIIEKILNDHGFLQAKVLSPDIEISPDKSSVSINYRMVENNQYLMDNLSISGSFIESNKVIYDMRKENDPDELLFLQSDIAKLIKQEKGKPFNKSLIANNIMAIADKYKNEGYAYVNISPIPRFNGDSDKVGLDIIIESGPKVLIEKIDIQGNTKTVDEVIRREMVLFEQDTYSSSLMMLSEQNINRLGYFETVEVTAKAGSSQEKMIINIKVKEKSTGNIQVGAGYGTGGEGIVFRGQIGYENFLGRGQSLSATVNWSNYRRMFDISFVEPYLTYLFDNPLTIAFTVYNRSMFLGEFSKKSTGGDITLGYPIGSPFAAISRKWKRNVSPNISHYVPDFEALSLLLTYTAERSEIDGLVADVRKWDLFEGVPRYTTSFKSTIRLDQRNNRLFPSRGYYLELRAELASGYFGGLGLSSLENYWRTSNKGTGREYLKPNSEVNNFIRYGANFRFYHNLDDWFFLKGLVLKANVELGLLNTFGNPMSFENYSIGGLNTVRGYPYRSISPVERVGAIYPFDPQKQIHVGGNKQLYGSVELEFPIIKALNISGVLFWDFGNTYSHEDNFFYLGGKSKYVEKNIYSDPLKIYQGLGLYSSVGFGFRWLSPIGYLRFEWGIPIVKRNGVDPDIAFEFNIGPSF